MPPGNAWTLAKDPWEGLYMKSNSRFGFMSMRLDESRGMEYLLIINYKNVATRNKINHNNLFSSFVVILGFDVSTA